MTATALVTAGAGFAAGTVLAVFAESVPEPGQPFGCFWALTGSIVKALANTRAVHTRVACFVIFVILNGRRWRASLNTPPCAMVVIVQAIGWHVTNLKAMFAGVGEPTLTPVNRPLIERDYPAKT